MDESEHPEDIEDEGLYPGDSIKAEPQARARTPYHTANHAVNIYMLRIFLILTLPP